jgi:hypothetical protein
MTQMLEKRQRPMGIQTTQIGEFFCYLRKLLSHVEFCADFAPYPKSHMNDIVMVYLAML